jgi:hypothetical protein
MATLEVIMIAENHYPVVLINIPKAVTINEQQLLCKLEIYSDI